MVKRAKNVMAIVRKGDDGMNTTERAYAMKLEAERIDGTITTWRFEPLKFRIGKACFYTPDFEVVTKDGHLEYHEVKGRWMEDARVKIKVAASQYSDRRFVAVQWKKRVWVFEEIGAAAKV